MENLKIKTVAIVGAGAMGAAYASMFFDAGDFSVFFVARGERYRKLKQGPIPVNGRDYAFDVLEPEEVKTPADLVLVALKHHQLARAVDDIKLLADDNTIILSVMNGLESEKIIGAACGMEKMVYAIAVGIDAVREGGRFTYARPGRIIFGKGPAGSGEKVLRLREALGRAAIPCETPEDMLRVMWWKFMINVGINQASAVLQAPYGVFQSSPDAVALMRSLMEEVIALAQKASVNLTQADMEEWLPILATLSPEGKTSMLQDVEAKRKTEVEVFAGTVVSLGETYEVPTPVNRTVLLIIKAIEQKNRLSSTVF
jgi:2-dehydropantoate 2-reductase